jgi:hypothetical protein
VAKAVLEKCCTVSAMEEPGQYERSRKCEVDKTILSRTSLRVTPGEIVWEWMVMNESYLARW